MIDGIEYKIVRWSDDDHLYKTILYLTRTLAGRFQHTEKVAKFTIDDFRLMFQVLGLLLEKIFGYYELTDSDIEHSPRQIMIVAK